MQENSTSNRSTRLEKGLWGRKLTSCRSTADGGEALMLLGRKGEKTGWRRWLQACRRTRKEAAGCSSSRQQEGNEEEVTGNQRRAAGGGCFEREEEETDLGLISWTGSREGKKIGWRLFKYTSPMQPFENSPSPPLTSSVLTKRPPLNSSTNK